MLRNEIYEFHITATGIDTVAEKIEGYLTTLKMERKNVLRIRLSIEEILLKWRERFGEDTALCAESGHAVWPTAYLSGNAGRTV